MKIYEIITILCLGAVGLGTIPPTDAGFKIAPTEVTPEVSIETTPERKAALDTIAFGEGTYNAMGYKTLFGHQIFDSFAKHPERCIPFRDTCTTAAGRYQFLDFRWKEISQAYGLKDFSPENQDKAAIALLTKESGKATLDKIDKGDPEWIHEVCETWASFPCRAGDTEGAHNQNPKKSEALKQFYLKRLKHYGGT